MTKKSFKFSTAATDMYFGGNMLQLKQLIDQKNAVVITDENVFNAHQKKFRNWNTIVLKPGEEYKVQQTADAVIDQLITLKADRSTMIVGVGGGVITDLAGYVASVYMRGLPFGFVPTTLLAMVDASIGGKNGIDVGVYKNMVGTIRQPAFIFHDYSLLTTLPENEWRNGFAEIIKHACIADAKMFRELAANSLEIYRRKKSLLAALIQKNALIKIKKVQQDEFENGERRLLNFGHTLGHALENQYELSHGEAISIGMTYAAKISEELAGFKQSEAVADLLRHYGLPTLAAFKPEKAIDILQMDKKKEKDSIRYVLLQRIGKAFAQQVPIDQLAEMITEFQKRSI